MTQTRTDHVRVALTHRSLAGAFVVSELDRSRGLAIPMALALLVERSIAWACIDGDSCGQGYTDGLRAALFMDGVSTVLCIALLLVSRRTTMMRVAVLPVAMVAFVGYANLGLRTIAAGHHPCGAEYDAYTAHLGVLDWAALPALCFYNALIIGAVCVAWGRAWRARWCAGW